MYLSLRKKGEMVHNKYLLFVLVAEKINVGKIKGGGKVKNLIDNNINLIPSINI